MSQINRDNQPKNPSQEEEIVMLPRKSFRDSYEPIRTIPAFLHFREIRKRFGIDVANIVYLIYKIHGEKISKYIVNRILKINSIDELVKYLMTKTRIMDSKTREILSKYLLTIRFNYYFDSLLEYLEKNRVGEPVRTIAVRVFHCFARKGVFYSAKCIVALAEHIARKKRVPKHCLSVEKYYRIICREEEGGVDK